MAPAASSTDAIDPLPRRSQVASEEGDDLRPQLRRRRRAVAGPVVGEEGMAGALVDVHFDLSSAPADRRVARALAQPLTELGRGVLVLGPDRRKQRAAQLLDQLERRRGALGRGAFLEGRFVDEPSPAVHRRVQALARAGEQERVAPAHAEAYASEPAAGVLAPEHERGGAFEVADGALVGYREDPLHHRSGVIHRRWAAFARVQVNAQRGVAEVGEAVGHVPDVLAESAGLVNHYDRRPRCALGARGGRGEIAVYGCVPGAG